MSLLDCAVGLVGTGILVLPGWLLARARSLPHALLAGFILSVVTLFVLVQCLVAVGLPLTKATLGCGWTIFVLAAVLQWRAHRAKSPVIPAAEKHAWQDARLLLPLAPMFVVVIYRASTQPLFGVDTIFRWNYLAEQMLSRSSLDFYPPVSSADYEVYSWPDGIAPVVSTLYFWIYLIAGAARRGLTAPLIVLQVVMVAIAVHALARKTFSGRAASFACALVACSPLIAWSTAMGQETGLTAIALLGLLVYMPRYRREERPATLVIAAAAAGMGALAREYGLSLIVLGMGIGLARRLSVRGLGLFAAVAFATAGPWYIRNWLRTGNPLFNLAIGGWFPVNTVHSWLNESLRFEHGWSNLPPGAWVTLVVNCAAAVVGGVAGGILHGRNAKALLAAVACMVMVWIASLSYTAAGFTYSLRVLNPALCLAAVLGGAALAKLVPGPANTNAVVLALYLFATDSALRALTLPANVYRIPSSQWTAVGNAVHEYHERPLYRELARVAGESRILTLGPNVLLTRVGARTVPLWSPEVRFLLDPSVNDAARRLQELNIGFVVLNAGEVNARFLAHSEFLRNPRDALQLLWADEDMAFYRVNAAAPLK